MIKKKEGENMKQDERLKDIPANSYFHDVLQRFCAHKPAMVSAFVLTLEIILVIALPYILHLDPYTSDYEVMFGSAPSAIHWLGTDDIGRDIFARFIYGGRVSLSVGIISAVISMAVGVPLGLLAGYYRGIAETLIMRCADVFMSFPAMVTIVIGVLGWPKFARLIYGNVLSAREQDYVEAARAIGTKDGTILTKYILPNTFAPVLISFTFRAAQAIITESALSFLGMGVQAPQASWGNILYDAQSISVPETVALVSARSGPADNRALYQFPGRRSQGRPGHQNGDQIDT